MFNMKESIRVFIILIAGLILVCAVDPLAANDRKRIALLDFDAVNTQQTYARAVGNILEVELHKAGRFDILERKQMGIMLKEQGLALTGCTDDSCAIQIGKLLSADMVVTGSLNKFGDYLLAVKVVDVRSGKIVLADYERAVPEDQLPDRVHKMAVRISSAIGGAVREERTAEKVPEKGGGPKEESRGLSHSFRVESSLNGHYISPVGKFSDIAKPGYGISLDCVFRDLAFGGFFAGADVGYWSFEGNRENVDRCVMVPLIIEAGYSFDIYHGLYISPIVGGGYSYNTMTFKRTVWTSAYATEHEFEPVARGGLCTGYSNGSISAKIGVFYTGIFEKTERLDSYMISAGFGVSM